MNAQPTRIISYLLIGAGVLLFGLNAFQGGSLNIALPLVFLMLGGMFFLLVYRLKASQPWAASLYIPGALFVALGLIFLLNVVTGDWAAWAYAWLLLVAALGLGLLLADRPRAWNPAVQRIAWGLLLGGISFFAIFGAITGGLLIQVMAPILLILGGVALRWMRLDTALLDSLRGRGSRPVAILPSQPPGLVEPLSAREVEVLRLLDAGLSNQQIAARLNIAASTVKTHINNLYGKLGVQTRVQAVNRARELGLLEPLA
jgi:DNA-binding CsgD family transcriptional regulator/FtsH-binding integral membrane protein